MSRPGLVVGLVVGLCLRCRFFLCLLVLFGFALGAGRRRAEARRHEAQRRREAAALARREAEAAARKAAGGMLDRPVGRPTKKQRRQIHRFKESG